MDFSHFVISGAALLAIIISSAQCDELIGELQQAEHSFLANSGGAEQDATARAMHLVLTSPDTVKAVWYTSLNDSITHPLCEYGTNAASPAQRATGRS